MQKLWNYCHHFHHHHPWSWVAVPNVSPSPLEILTLDKTLSYNDTNSVEFMKMWGGLCSSSVPWYRWILCCTSDSPNGKIVILQCLYCKYICGLRVKEETYFLQNERPHISNKMWSEVKRPRLSLRIIYKILCSNTIKRLGLNYLISPFFFFGSMLIQHCAVL